MKVINGTIKRLNKLQERLEGEYTRECFTGTGHPYLKAFACGALDGLVWSGIVVTVVNTVDVGLKLVKFIKNR